MSKYIKINMLFLGIIFLFTGCNFSDHDTQSKQNIPTINIVKQGEISWTDKERCMITYTENGKSINIPATIKKRGGSSSKFYKNSFTIKLNKKFGLCNIAHENDWIFNANYIDKTFMRHKLSYDLYRQMKPENTAPRCGYAFVEHNRDSLGLYVVMEKVNSGMIGVDKTDTMSMVFKEPKIFFENRLPIGNIRDTTNYYDQRYPDISVSNKTWFIEEFKNFLFYSSDSDFLEEIDKRIDIANVIDWHLLLLFSNNSDGIMKNFFLYKNNSVSPLRIAIWDYDHSFGRDGDNEMNMMEHELDCNRSILLKRLMHIPGSEYPDKLKERWWALRNNNIFTYQNIEELVAQNNSIIEEAVKKNAEIWPVDDKWYFDSNNYHDELKIILEFAQLRINQLDSYFSHTQVAEN